MQRNETTTSRFLLRVIAGYVLAVVVAVLTTVVTYGTVTVLSDQGAIGSTLPAFLQGVPVFLMFGLWITVFTAIPGFVTTMVVAETTSLRSWSFFVVCGVLTAFTASYLTPLWEWVFVGSPPANPVFPAAIKPVQFHILIGGAAGGYAYWRAFGWWLHSK